MASEADHVHHPNADHSVEFKGYAAYEKKGDVKPFAYNPQKLADDFVELQISHCGICGSDLHMIDSGWRPAPYPIIVGHEIIGTVTAAGPAVKNVKVGDRVGVGAQCGSCLNRNNDCEECGTGWEQACRRSPSYTYASRRPDGQVTQGGYAEKIRLQSDFAFKIPESISSAEAAPLMCGGVTVFAPLQRHLTKPGMKVGIIGIGGLGHMAVKFAAKMHNGACEVTAISHNSKKQEESLKLGAHKFLDTSNKEDIKKHFRYFDFILSTANGNNMAITEWLSMIRMGGTFCTVGAPEEPMSIGIWPLLNQVKVTGSGIGSIKEINEMLAFADKHNVRPQIEVLPMDQANVGIQKVRDNTVRFRVVLENPRA